MNDVRRQLVVFERNGRILKWHDRMIPAGAEWRSQIDGRLERADIVLLFVSPHFIESRYCYEVEGQVALRRHHSGAAQVIPVILRPCSWEATPFAELQALPQDGKPVTRWDDRDEACLNVARGVMAAVDARATPPPGRVRRHESTTTAPFNPALTTALTYCGRCGQRTGSPSSCTGGYTHHSFQNGADNDFCSRCGQRPGSSTMCTGGHSHHAFGPSSAGSTYCSRCGVSLDLIRIGGRVSYVDRRSFSSSNTVQ